jgi:hypothetical protein
VRIIQHQETLIDYDSPQLFVAHDQFNTSYLCLAVECTEQRDKFICVPVSERRLADFYQASLDLRNIYEHPESDELFYANVTGELTEDIQLIPMTLDSLPAAWLPAADFFFQKEFATETMKVLQLGCGDNPMTSAINTDRRIFQGVDVVANATELPFPPNCFQQIFSHNPFGYNPVSKGVAEVLKKGGTLIVTGQPRNPFFKNFLKTISPKQLLELGFELVELEPIDPSLIIGTPKNTTGKPLDTSVMIHALFRKIK